MTETDAAKIHFFWLYNVDGSLEGLQQYVSGITSLLDRLESELGDDGLDLKNTAGSKKGSVYIYKISLPNKIALHVRRVPRSLRIERENGVYHVINR
ncbi:MAG: hypothetical protein ACLFS1_02795, partial [Opitutales bacterium]